MNIDGIQSTHHLEELLGNALLASLIAGDAVRQVYNSGFKVSYKNDKTPLTEADQRSHEILAGRLGKDIPLLSEEGRDAAFEERRNWELYWLIDPLDGTKEFVKRNGEFTVNVALMEGEKPVAGIVYLPAKKCLFFGARWLGAFRVDSADIDEIEASIQSKSYSVLDQALSRAVRLPLSLPEEKSLRIKIVQSITHVTPEEANFINKLKTRFDRIDTSSAGSSLKLCVVAEGSADLYPRFGPTMEWDTAAGQCVAEAAGCEVIDLAQGKPLAYNKPVLRNSSFLVIGSRIKSNPQLKQAVLDCATLAP